MCAALEVTHSGRYYLLLTDKDDTLSWDRNLHEGWRVALYEPSGLEGVDGALSELASDDGSAASAVALVMKLSKS